MLGDFFLEELCLQCGCAFWDTKPRKPMDSSVLYLFLATSVKWFLFQGNSHGFLRGNHLKSTLNFSP